MTRLIFVTGGLGDIGAAIARKFAAHGWRIAVNDLAPKAEGERRLAELLRADTPEARYFSGDNTDPAAVTALIADVVRQSGVPDVVAINAGVVDPAPLLDLSPDRWRHHLDVNLTGAFLIAQTAAQAMRDARATGALLFTSSWVQDVPSRGIGAYCVSKAGLKMLARQLALELGADGIRVNVVAPGVVDAGLSGQMFRAGQADRGPFERAIPLHHIQTAAQVADAFWLLAQPEAAYITGASLVADGGMSLFNWQEL